MQKIIWSLALCFGLWLAGLLWFAAKIPDASPAIIPNADAIVVLTGAGGRVEYGLALLAKGNAPRLFVSGVGREATVVSLLRLATPDVRKAVTELPEGSVALGREAVNTIGNAVETARWLHENEYHSILLVTSNYHMPRALNEFYAAMPDIAVMPAPLFVEWWKDEDTWLLVISEYHKFVAASLRHWLFT